MRGDGSVQWSIPRLAFAVMHGDKPSQREQRRWQRHRRGVNVELVTRPGRDKKKYTAYLVLTRTTVKGSMFEDMETRTTDCRRILAWLTAWLDLSACNRHAIVDRQTARR
jgi:hypothetical protein